MDLLVLAKNFNDFRKFIREIEGDGKLFNATYVRSEEQLQGKSEHTLVILLEDYSYNPVYTVKLLEAIIFKFKNFEEIPTYHQLSWDL